MSAGRHECPLPTILIEYVPIQVSGVIRIRGTEMMTGLLRRFAREFRALQPNVQFDIALHGSEEAIPALTAGTADLGVMDRDLTDEEAASFAATFGVPPTNFQTAIDTVAIVVQDGNPLAANDSGVTLRNWTPFTPKP